MSDYTENLKEPRQLFLLRNLLVFLKFMNLNSNKTVKAKKESHWH